MAGTEGSAPGSSGGSPRKRTALIVAVIVLVPVALGVVVGWYGFNPRASERYSPVGSEAHDLLSGFPDDSLVVEIDYQNSMGPPPAASMSLLEQRINETCTKASVSVQEFGFESKGTSFHEGDLYGVELSARHNWPSYGTFVLDYLYLAGSDADNPSVLGAAYLGGSIAVFGGTISSAAPFGSATGVTSTVFIHEFGHELGLVGIIGSASNEDPQHPYHSTDPNDVMYWAVETTGVLSGLVGGSGPPTQFDAADVADLSSVRSAPILEELLPYVVAVAAAAALLVLVVRRRRRAPPPPPE